MGKITLHNIKEMHFVYFKETKLYLTSMIKDIVFGGKPRHGKETDRACMHVFESCGLEGSCPVFTLTLVPEGRM